MSLPHITRGRKSFLMGDYNVNTLTNSERQLSQFCNNLDLCVVNESIPTRVESTNASIIDHFICSDPAEYETVIVDTDFPTHLNLSTYVSIHKHTTTADIKYVYDKRNYSKEAFCNDLENANWSSIYTQSCADDMLKTF